MSTLPEPVVGPWGVTKAPPLYYRCEIREKWTEATLAGSFMDLKEILSHLERNEGHFPKAVNQEAIARRDRIVAIRGILLWCL
jgi:hypothetical protein